MKYPIGIQTFERIRKDGFVYVDKTDFVYQFPIRDRHYQRLDDGINKRNSSTKLRRSAPRALLSINWDNQDYI